MAQKIKIKASDAVRDIRSGMTDFELMERYGLSAKGLQSLILKLMESKAITRTEIEERRKSYHDTLVLRRLDESSLIEDIRSGISDSDLMVKYDLSADGLRTMFQNLMKAKAITPEDLYGASTSVHDTVFVENLRALPRNYLAMAVDIYQWKHAEIRGLLNDVTEKGVGISGMPARIGEVMILAISGGDFIHCDPIVFEAECRWASREKETGEWLAGFEITNISETCLEDLRRLIECLPFLD